MSALTAEWDSTASRKDVWDVMADGWTYSQWVVGNSRMRAVDPDWPSPASKIHHTIGVWPIALNDETTVESCVPVNELVLLAKGRPFGAARVTLRLSDVADGCHIEMDEVLVNAPFRWLPDQVTMAAAVPRNMECLRRLASLAERRTRP